MAVAWAGFATLPRVLDLISVGSESAAARGVNVERTERIALVSASLATGAAVSLAGPVSFVGIVVPHLVRLIVGADHRLVLPASALFGARLSDRLRPDRAHDLRAARAAGRHRHRHHRRTGFSMAAVPTRVIAARCSALAFGLLLSLARPWLRLKADADRYAPAGTRRRCPSDDAAPQRIVSLVPATTEMLFAMGAGDRLVGVSNYDRFPPEVARLPQGRRAARSGRRADPVAEARSGHRLRDADRSEAAARTRAGPDLPTTPTAGCRTSPRRCARSARGSA